MSRTTPNCSVQRRFLHRPLVAAVRGVLGLGALAPLALVVGSHASAGLPIRAVDPLPRPPSALVFIDPRVPDYARLLAGLRSDARALVLDPQRDGLAQIAEAVADLRGLEAIHLISHGAPGRLQLGTTELTEANLPEHPGALAIIRRSLAEDGDLLLYGCEVGRGEVGERFIGTLALATGADLGASDDRTGHAALGGDWALEVRTGDVDAEVPIDSVARRQWRGLLPFSGYINFSNVNNAGNYMGPASVNASFTVGAYILVADGLSFGTGAASFGGDGYVATSYHSNCPLPGGSPPLGPETKLTLLFQNNETFDASSIQIYHLDCPGTAAQTFTITSDKGGSVTSPSLVNRNGLGPTTVNLGPTGFTGVTRLYITPSSGTMGLQVSGLTVANVAPGDSTAPTVGITRDNASPTNAASVAFSVDFSEAVTNVDGADFVISTSGSASGSVQSVTGSSPNFTVTVGNVSGDGTLGLDIASGTNIQDTAGNPLNQTPTTDQVYTIDKTGPSISDSNPAANAVNEGAANGTAVGLTISTSEGTPSLTDNAGGRFALSGNNLVVANGAALDAETSTSHQVTVAAADGLGNPTQQNFTITVNDLAPTFSIVAASASKAEGNSGATAFTFTVTRGTDTTGSGSVAYAVSGAAAANGADFGGSLPSGTQGFADGATSETLSIQVTGDTAAEADEGFTVTLSNPSDGGSLGTSSANGTILNDDLLPIEVGQGLFTGHCAAVDLNASYTNPVVILGPPTDFDLAPAIARVCTAGATGFDARLQEWPSEDGLHGVEQLAFLVGEAGRYVLGDGSTWELGTFNLGGDTPASVDFSSAFPGTPALFLGLQTQDDATPAVVRASGLGNSGFTATLQEEEASVAVHGQEQVGYLAVYPANAAGTLPIDTGLPYALVSPPLSLDEQPVVIGKTDLRVQEETSKDAETDHAPETVNVLRLGADGKDLLAQDVSLNDADTAALRQLGWDEDQDGLADAYESEVLGTDPATPTGLVTGDDGNNIVTGTGGADVLIPGRGQDRITTGAGADRIVYTSREDAGDQILDFTPGQDLLVLGQLLGAAGYSGADPIGDGYVQIIGSASVSVVRFDVDGSGPTPPFVVAILPGVPVATMRDPGNFAF